MYDTYYDHYIKFNDIIGLHIDEQLQLSLSYLTYKIIKTQNKKLKQLKLNIRR
jgi:hypothetical protein